ncbi:MarR family winged helix-turn-helix transcriptional regulator [Spongiactinospora sp. TRM90649]|uniref:MarR family winged helix-turn-helix transcriptional regulator n=1 Tax=Spongiactinospora sp. TRM90649 TaxID=3031114 RepID=UPI0023F86C1E|nr:MarR family winged helix-turn-helix transcriptional regulator [Spongiactinospora sp. TRM90649]MDF5758877.1 MarR family winged helix-turn-helix transcriptional regulator [Spongiactinospora sp. TRM90649]
MTGHHTLRQTEEAIGERLGGLNVDFEAMWAVSNIYRASSAIRNHLEQTVLRDTGLTWTGFVVMWVVWIWGDSEPRHVAAEAGISKGTLTGVVKTLESYRHLRRFPHPTDGRRVMLALTVTGERLMRDLFPEFNRQEAFVVKQLDSERRRDLAISLKRILEHLESV